MIIRKSPAEIELMASAGVIVADTLALLGESIRPGVTTAELDALAEEHIVSQGGVPTFKGYKGYPAATCLSPNDMIVHGIPGNYTLREGDILSADVGVTLDGFVADSAYTFAVGEIPEQAERLLDTCQAALDAAIEQCREGNRLSDVSHAVQQVAEGAGYSVVRELSGHGIGRSMHEDPQILNFGAPGRGPVLAEGMTLAVEPMITMGGPEISVHDDRWSISTQDGSLAAHFEHTVAVTGDSPRILTGTRVLLR
ncbi:MAG TPA: type I methionyl aminopeptidase [Gaiellaceae bacterium]|nr:type I methionyl aminopeptidase [Gaiellaceae bacterium]